MRYIISLFKFNRLQPLHQFHKSVFTFSTIHTRDYVRDKLGVQYDEGLASKSITLSHLESMSA
jgi:hypothetical protein